MKKMENIVGAGAALAIILIGLSDVAGQLPRWEPNDPYFSYQGFDGQWALEVIDAPEGWWLLRGDPPTTPGNSDIVVGVFDGGCDLLHEDLVGVLWDNGQGICGYDFVTNTPITLSSFFAQNHGTHVGGIVAGEGDNAKGVVGVAWGCKMMIVRYCDYDWPRNAEAVRYAVANGARVINMSWGWYTFSPEMQEAIREARNAGCILVAGAGNNSADLDHSPFYPACYDGVLSVGATTMGDSRSPFSNYGMRLDVSAPGGSNADATYPPCVVLENIFSTMPSNSYWRLGGTSMAAPHVAGLASLCLSADDTLAPRDVEMLICDYADDLGAPGKDPEFGSGRINVHATLAAIVDPEGPIPAIAGTPSPAVDATDVSVRSPLRWERSLWASSYDVYLGTSPGSMEFQGNQEERVLTAASMQPGTTYYWRVDARNWKNVQTGTVWQFTTATGNVIRVDIDNTDPSPDGTTWAKAYNSLEDAITAAGVDDEIWVRASSNAYMPQGGTRESSLLLKEWVSLFGGFAGSESLRDQRDCAANQTVLSGDVGEPGSEDNCYHVVTGANNAIIDGFTIVAGNANGSEDYGRGGGLFSVGTGLLVRNCAFTDNCANDGGGLYQRGGLADIGNCVFSRNEGARGAGVFHECGSIMQISNCVFAANTATVYGGAIFNGEYTIVFVTNCTITQCAAYAFYQYKASGSKISSSILWDNGGEDLELYAFGGSTRVRPACEIDHCDIEEALTGEYGVYDMGGNIPEDPGFMNPVEGDFHLSVGSPCIDAGDPEGEYAGQCDMDGEPRVVNGRVDMGADEKTYCFPYAETYLGQHDKFVEYVNSGFTEVQMACWCDWPYQCDGDAAGDKHVLGYRVYATDLDTLSASWRAKLGDANLNPCADVAHDTHILGYRVYTTDLNVLSANWRFCDAGDESPACEENNLVGDCPRADPLN